MVSTKASRAKAPKAAGGVAKRGGCDDDVAAGAARRARGPRRVAGSGRRRVGQRRRPRPGVRLDEPPPPNPPLPTSTRPPAFAPHPRSPQGQGQAGGREEGAGQARLWDAQEGGAQGGGGGQEGAGRALRVCCGCCWARGRPSIARKGLQGPHGGLMRPAPCALPARAAEHAHVTHERRGRVGRGQRAAHRHPRAGRRATARPR
jgi:hypothetical protein